MAAVVARRGDGERPNCGSPRRLLCPVSARIDVVGAAASGKRAGAAASVRRADSTIEALARKGKASGSESSGPPLALDKRLLDDFENADTADQCR